MSTRNVLVVEDDALLRELIATALEANGYAVQAAGDIAEAKRILRSTDPDGVVLDIDLGQGPTGFDFAQIISKESPGTGIVFLTQLPDPRFSPTDENGIPTGVAYIRKSALADLNVLYEALDLAMRGQVTKLYRHDLDAERPFAKLTVKQIEVLKLMAQGNSNAQIATARGTSLKATEDAIRRACAAIGIDGLADGNSRTRAVAKFISVVGPQSAKLEDKALRN
ncbi:MAG: response regulator [Candidatus Nanopelagicales bacterium]|nr:response regulator [Candidatus Nanopelagicales bacterium]